MKDYLKYAFNVRQNISNLTEELDSTVQKFLECAVKLVEWGCPVSDDAVKCCVDYYLHEFIAALKIKTCLIPEYHEYKDRLTVAILRPLINDARYEKTCYCLNVEPCGELYQKIKI
jgi:hypothetical protein